MSSATLQALFLLLFMAIALCAFYFIVKLAVKNGILQAYKKINEQSAKNDNYK